MNDKAKELGMKNTSFRDPAGLHHGNLSTAADLSTLVDSAYRYPLIRALTTVRMDFVTDHRTGWKIRFVNTNRLVRNRQWNIDLSKTGYIADAGHCLVMRAEIVRSSWSCSIRGANGANTATPTAYENGSTARLRKPRKRRVPPRNPQARRLLVKTGTIQELFVSPKIQITYFRQEPVLFRSRGAGPG